MKPVQVSCTARSDVLDLVRRACGVDLMITVNEADLVAAVRALDQIKATGLGAASTTKAEPGDSNMQIYGTIRAKNGGTSLTYDRWCEFVSHCRDLVRANPITGRNPKTGEPMTIRPRPDGASVVIDAQRVGFVEWTQSGDDEVFVCGDPNKIVPWATAVAIELGAEFAEIPGN